jgi:hypothetical protein
VGEFINAFRHGSLVMQVPQVPDTLTVAPPIEGGSGDSGSGATAMAVDGPTVGPGGPGADAATDPTMSAAPTLLFATVNGVIGVVAQLPPKQYQRFIKLQVCIQPIGWLPRHYCSTAAAAAASSSPPPPRPPPLLTHVFTLRGQAAMTKIVQGVGGLSHTEWRSFHNERKTQECRGFIDGDLVEMFLDLPRPKMEEVVKLITDSTGSFGSVRGGGEDMSGITVEDLLREVEEVQRIHT